MKNLRAKMIFAVFLTVVSVFALTLVIVHFALRSHTISQADGMTQIISRYNGEVPEMQEYEQDALQGIWGQIIFTEESPFRTRYFVAYFNEAMEVEMINIEHVASISAETARTMAEKAISGKDTVGYIDAYRFRIAETGDGQIYVIFLDCSENFASQRVTDTVLGASLILFTVLITFLFAVFSKRIFKPFEENARRQKQFITDASHELKTPLAIISANAEVLAYKDGGNQWIQNITDQVRHMGDLINDLLILSKMEEFDGNVSFTAVNLSTIVSETLSSFREVFRQKDVAMQTDIAPGIMINGDERQLRMLISILMENASKYVSESGILKVSLSGSVRHAVFRIFNTAEITGGINPKYLFDRFYRPDSARTSSKGGHGIGLSIAKKITVLHNGSISARQIDGGICFTVELPPMHEGKRPVSG